VTEAQFQKVLTEITPESQRRMVFIAPPSDIVDLSRRRMTNTTIGWGDTYSLMLFVNGALR
jgi:hypothetical protein